MFASVCEVIEKILGHELAGRKLTPETRLDDIGFDSVRYLDLMLSFEDITDLPIDEIAEHVDLLSIQTIGDAVRFLSKLSTRG